MPPLLPHHEHLLRHGEQRPPGLGQKSGRAKVRSAEGLREWDGTWTCQSTAGLVMSLLSEIKSQGIWSKEQAWVELTDPANVGGAWLQRQDDPRATFEDFWERAYVVAPKLSFEQMTRLLLEMIEEKPGIQLVLLREAASRCGWTNRGHLDDLLAGLAARGDLREERTFGPSGKQCTSRRFWITARQTVAAAARAATMTLSIALLATSVATASAKGHRTTTGGALSYRVLLTSKRARARGLRIWRGLAARTRERSRHVAASPPPVDPVLAAELLRLIEFGPVLEPERGLCAQPADVSIMIIRDSERS